MTRPTLMDVLLDRAEPDTRGRKRLVIALEIVALLALFSLVLF